MNLDIFYQNILHYCVFTFTLVFCHIVLLRSHFSLASKYKFKVLWTTTAFGLVYGLLSLLGLYFLNIELRKSIEAKLLGYAPSYAITFEKMNYEKFHEKTARDDKTYLDLIDLQKKWLEKNPYISDIYTMKLGADGNIRLIVDSETDYNRDGQFSGERELRTEIGEIFSKDLPELKSAFQGQTSLVNFESSI